MKKLARLCILLGLLIIPINVFASSDIKLWMNGKYVKTDVAPVIENQRTLVPLRVISENLGLEVEWDQEKQAVMTYKETEVGPDFSTSLLLILGDNKVAKPAEEAARTGELYYTLDVAPKAINNRTMVPIRFIAEAYGIKVDWDQKNQTVIIGDGYKAPKASHKQLSLNANSVALKLKAEGLPIDRIIVYNKQNDVNKLMGKPGQYTSKVNFSIQGLPQEDPADPNGGSVEVFKTNADAVKRRNYITKVIKSDPVLSTYNYHETMYIKDNILLRLHPDNWDRVEEYKQIFEKL